MLELLEQLRGREQTSQGYGPANLLALLRALRGHLRGLDLSCLALRGVSLQGVEMQDARLSGAVLQDSVFTEAFDAITAVAISRTGQYRAAASRRGEVLVWDEAGQTLRRAWRAHTDLLYALAFSPNGGSLASGSWDGMVKLWDAATGALLWSGRHTGHVNSVAFSPQGSMLASSGDDETVRLWDVQSGMQLHSLPHCQLVIPLAWSPDGRLLATGDVEGCIRLWEVQTNQLPTCAQTLSGHTTWVDGLAFSPDGSTLASASNDGTVGLWDVSDGRLRQTLTGHTNRVTRVAWSPDGCILASSSFDQTIWLWDVEQRSYRTALRGYTAVVVGVAFTPESRSLLSGSEDGTLRVWDTTSGQCVRVMQGYATSLYDVDWSPDGTQLISAGSDTLVTIFDVPGRTPPRVLGGHSGVVVGVGWSSDGRTLASSELDNAIRLWDPTSGDCLQVLQYPDDPGNFFYGLAWSPDGQRLAAGTYRRGVQVLEITAHSRRWVGRELPTWIRPVAWSPDGALLAGGGDDGTVYVWNAEEGTLLQQHVEHHSKVTSVAWSPDGMRFASAGGGREGGELFVWDVQSGACVRALVEHPGIVFAVAWSPRGQLLISGDSDGMLRWWELGSGECVRVQAAHQGTVQALKVSPNGSTMASCGDDGAILLWDLDSGKHLQTLRRDRPYERMDISGLTGITDAQRASLIALGAQEQPSDRAALPPTTPDPATAEEPTRDGQKVASTLPVQSTSFIGRSQELDAIARLLADPECRLLTLLGPGGIGKTRLALAVAATQTAAFADGVAFVALAAVGTPNQFVSAIGNTLQFDFAGRPNPTADLLDYLRARHLLLVLDNFEHLLDGADMVADILAHTPHITLLITSRERLNLQAEWLFDVEGLAYPQQDPTGSIAPQCLADLTAYSAIQLFVQRAKQVLPGLSVSFPTLTTIVRICQHVAGMPLAIELAAAGVHTLPLAAIERQIRANLDVLATTCRDVPIRHRSMRAVFDHSWQLLSEGERALFSHVAVFRGGWTAEAAEAVCAQGKKQKAKGATENSDEPLLPFTFTYGAGRQVAGAPGQRGAADTRRARRAERRI